MKKQLITLVEWLSTLSRRKLMQLINLHFYKFKSTQTYVYADYCAHVKEVTVGASLYAPPRAECTRNLYSLFIAMVAV